MLIIRAHVGQVQVDLSLNWLPATQRPTGKIAAQHKVTTNMMETTAKERKSSYNQEWETDHNWGKTCKAMLREVKPYVGHEHTLCPTNGLLGSGHPNYIRMTRLC
jgi:hypothetical protein